VLPEGTEVEVRSGGQAMLSAESSRQVWQTCMRCEALCGRCSQMLLPEGTEVEVRSGG